MKVVGRKVLLREYEMVDAGAVSQQGRSAG